MTSRTDDSEDQQLLTNTESLDKDVFLTCRTRICPSEAVQQRSIRSKQVGSSPALADHWVGPRMRRELPNRRRTKQNHNVLTEAVHPHNEKVALLLLKRMKTTVYGLENTVLFKFIIIFIYIFEVRLLILTLICMNFDRKMFDKFIQQHK